jgi:hypothetical protein
MEVRSIDDFEIDEDIRHSETEWRLERAGWIVMGLVTLAALLGVLGPGALSQRSASDGAGTFTVRYDRFEHAHARSELRLEIAPAAIVRGSIQVWIDRSYLDGIRGMSMDPEPERFEVSSDRITYTYFAAEGPVSINIDFEFEECGIHRGRAGIPGGSEVAWRQLAYP